MSDTEMTEEWLAAETAARMDNLEAPDPDELIGVKFLAIPLDTQKALARNAEIYRNAFALVKAWGHKVSFWDGWETTSASMTLSKIVVPTSVWNHHTAGNSTPTRYIRQGDPLRGLTGPLANVHVLRDGTAWVLGVGYQNHAGNNDRACYDRVVAGTAPLDRDLVPGADSTFSANRWGVAIEANGDGGADDFTPEQHAVIRAINAAFHIVLKWPVDGKAPRVGAHKELTRRKPGDPVLSMGKLRTDVAALVREKMSATQPPTEPPVVETPATEPPVITPPPVVPIEAPFKIGVANLEGYGGNKDYAGRATWIKDVLNSSILALCESYPEAMRDAIRAKLGTSCKVYVHSKGKICVMWNSTKWTHIDKAEVDFGDNFHGAIRVGLKNVATGLVIDVISMHVRPKSVATLAQKQADLRKAATLYRGRPTILAGDHAQNDPDSQLPGWDRVTPKVDTMDATGTQPVDALFIRNPAQSNGDYIRLVKRDAKLLNPGAISDHKAWRVGLTVTKKPLIDTL